MPSLSLCIIVKDEEKFLERCLNSVKGLIDEIIVVDTGSKDKTIEIAKKFTDKVYNFEWCDDFSAARNFSLSKATKDWILVLDADEVIAEGDLGKIKELILDNDVDGYKLIQRNYSNSLKGISCQNDNYGESKGYNSYIPSTLVRLFRNKGYKFQNTVHELVDDSIEQGSGRIAYSSIPIHHLEDESKNKTEIYLRLGKKQIELTPENPKPYYEVGKLYSINDLDLALVYFKKAIALLGSRTGLVINKLLYLETGITCFKLGDYKDAEFYLDKAVESDPKNCWPYFYKGLILHEKGRIKDAFEMYKKSVIKGIKDPVAYGNLGEICLKNKDYKNAFKLLSQACELGHPNQGEIKEVLEKLKKVV